MQKHLVNPSNLSNHAPPTNKEQFIIIIYHHLHARQQESLNLMGNMEKLQKYVVCLGDRNNDPSSSNSSKQINHETVLLHPTSKNSII